jgi:hypothetical protein
LDRPNPIVEIAKDLVRARNALAKMDMIVAIVEKHTSIAL